MCGGSAALGQRKEKKCLSACWFALHRHDFPSPSSEMESPRHRW
jgi:hypothetical protein